MNMKQNRDLAIKFDSITRELRESKYDLSNIKITTNFSHNTSYVTRRIME